MAGRVDKLSDLSIPQRIREYLGFKSYLVMEAD